MSELPQGWEQVSLTEIATVSTGKVDANHASELGKYTFFTCAMEPFKSETYSFEGELIILPGNGANVGHVAYYKGKIEAYQRTYILFDIEVFPKYLYWQLKENWKRANIDKQYGSATNYLKIGNFKNYNFPLAPLNEQIRIANKLDSLLRKLETTQKRLDKIPTLLKRFRQSVLAAAVTGELTAEWRNNQSKNLEIYSFEQLSSYEGKVLKQLPPLWGWSSFSDVAIIKSNLVDPKLTPNDIHLAPNHIEPDTGRIKEIKTIEQDGVKSGKHRFYKGQIIYSKIRPYLNKVVLVDFDGLCSADMYPIDSLINSKYLQSYFLSSQFVHWTSMKQSRVVLPKINQKGLSTIPVPVPPIEEQKQIVRQIEALFKLAYKVEQQYQAAKQRTDKLTQSILAKAFRGELVPQDPNDEPASELLKRIKESRA